MILGLSESCICLGGKWILKFKNNSAENQQNGPGMIPSNPPPQLVPLIPFLLTTIYLSQGIMLIYPTDQPIVNPTDFLSFSCLEDPDNQKCQQLHQSCSLQAETWRAGWEPAAFHGSISQTGDFSKLPSPFDHLTGLICSYQNFWRGMSDVSFWSRRERVRSLYFKLPWERRRLTHAKWSFQSFVWVIPTQEKESAGDKSGGWLLSLNW